MPPQASASPAPSLVAPDQLAQQIKDRWPEFQPYSDAVVLRVALGRHPEWRRGLPAEEAPRPGAVEQAASRATAIGPKPKQSWGAWARENLPTAGMAIGGGVGGPWGAALGGAAGEGYRQLIRAAQGLPTPTTELGAVGGMATEAALGGATEVGGTLAVRGTRTLLGGVYRGAMQAPEAQAARSAAETYRVPITPQELAGKPRSLLLGASRMGFTPFARNVAERAQAEAADQIAAGVQTSLTKLNTGLMTPGAVHTAEAAGEVAQQGLRLSHEVWRAQDTALYREVDQALRQTVTEVPVTTTKPSGLVGPTGRPLTTTTTSLVKQGLQVSLKPIKAFATRLAQQTADIEPALRKLAGADKGLLTFTDAMGQLPEATSFENANLLRSNLLAEVRKIKDLLPGRFKGLEKQIETLLDRQMQATAQHGGAEVVEAWRRANAFHAQGAEVFDRSIVGDLTAKDLAPEAIFKKVKSTAVTDARAVMRGFTAYAAYGSPAQRVLLDQARHTFQQGYLQQILKDPAKLTKALTEHQSVLNILMGGDPKAQAALAGVKQLAALQDRIAPIKGLSHWFGYETIGKIVSGGVGGLTLAATSAKGAGIALASVEGSAWVLAKILYSPAARRFLLDGWAQLPKGLDVAGPNLLRAVRVAFGELAAEGGASQESGSPEGGSPETGSPPTSPLPPRGGIE